MEYFIGKHPANNAIVGNGKVLALMQQYAGRTFEDKDLECYAMRKPIDKISRVLYPHYDRESSMLGEGGIYQSVRDSEEAILYDFYETWDTPHYFEKATGYLSVDSAQYVDGAGLYEVVSHKGVIVAKTTTWTPDGIDALVRKIEVSSYRKNHRKVDIFPQIHLKGRLSARDGIVISQVTNYGETYFVAVSCTEAAKWHLGDFHKGLNTGFNNANSIEQSNDTGKANVCFRATAQVPAGGFCDPVYLVLGFGGSEAEAVENLNKVLSSPARNCSDTLNNWNKWLTSGTSMTTPDKRLNYLWKVSKTIARMAVQHDGAPVYVGYWAYQGCVWIRDGAWIAMALARCGHNAEALQILRRLKSIVKIGTDGNICFNYNCRTGESEAFTSEKDSAGLLLAGIYDYYEHTGDEAFLAEFWDIAQHCADWICDHRDATGMIEPCAGIWEDFCPRRGRETEHMVWTSGVSAYGLSCMSIIAGKLNQQDFSKKYADCSEELLAGIKSNCIRDGVLCRSKETDHLDASVLTLFTWMPIFEAEGSLLRDTMAAIEDRIQDPLLGGIWRHEDLNVDLGDVQPWAGCTLWAAEACLKLGEAERAWRYIDWVVKNTSCCGLIPEHLAARQIPVGITMPSYSQAGFLVAMLRHHENRENTQPCSRPRLKFEYSR
ncbi:MAG: hypothetical protein SVT52_07815 [Planctomycetota bacterium]|nr:hypothetical protein [Planctomycetota bacterium]